MGITLDYSTSEPVRPEVVAAIKSELAHSVDHDWWCEPIMFYDATDDGCLHGGNKLFLIGYSYASPSGGLGFQQVDAHEDNFMACHDGSHILQLLANWSKKFGLTWIISLAGEHVGSIAKGEWDEDLRKYFELSCVQADYQPGDGACAAKARQISAKYASRNE